MHVWFRCCWIERLNPNAFLAFALIGIVVVAQASAAERTATARPATVADATRVLDLTTFPAMKGAKEPLSRSVSRLSYNVPGDCQTTFDFHRKTLTSMKWSEVSGSSVTKDYGSGMFTRDGFLASVSVAPLGDPSQPGTVNVSLTLHGNVDLAKLPIPADLKSTYVGPQIAMYTAGGSVTETAEACRKLLLTQGWQPYGKAGDTLFFKQNAIRLTVTITAAPALGGKTSVSFSAEQLHKGQAGTVAELRRYRFYAGRGHADRYGRKTASGRSQGITQPKDASRNPETGFVAQRHCVDQGFLSAKSREDQRRILAAEAEIVAHHVSAADLPSRVGDVVQVTIRIGRFVVDCRRHGVVAQGHDAHQGFQRPARRGQVARHALACWRWECGRHSCRKPVW